jgi:hypothetical protein
MNKKESNEEDEILYDQKDIQRVYEEEVSKIKVKEALSATITAAGNIDGHKLKS